MKTKQPHYIDRSYDHPGPDAREDPVEESITEDVSFRDRGTRLSSREHRRRC